MSFNIFSGLLNSENRQKRYVVENLENYINKSDAVCFGRYSSASDMMEMLAVNGVFKTEKNKGKNIYCASKRSMAYALSLGINPMRIRSTEDLRVIRESQKLYADSEHEVDAIVEEYGTGELSKKYIVCGDSATLKFARKKLAEKLSPGVDIDEIAPTGGPGIAILESSANERVENYTFIDGVDQVDQKNYVLVGDGMKLGFLKSYSMKDLKELMYLSKYFAAVSESPQAAYLGEGGKRLVVQYDPGMEAETLNILQKELMLTNDMLDGHVVKNSVARPQKKLSYDRGEMSVMTVPFDARLIDGTKTHVLLAERMVESEHGPIGNFGTGLCTNKRPHGVVYMKPKGHMEFNVHYQVHDDAAD